MNESGVIAEFIYSRLTVSGYGWPQVTPVWQEQVSTLISTLNGLVGVKIYKDRAPQGISSPWVVYSHHGGGGDQTVIGSRRVASRLVYHVRGVCTGEASFQASQVYDLVDEILQGSSGFVTLDGRRYLVQGFFRVNQIDSASVIEQTQFNQVGGLYRTIVQPYSG